MKIVPGTVTCEITKEEAFFIYQAIAIYEIGNIKRTGKAYCPQVILEFERIYGFCESGPLTATCMKQLGEVEDNG